MPRLFIKKTSCAYMDCGVNSDLSHTGKSLANTENNLVFDLGNER